MKKHDVMVSALFTFSVVFASSAAGGDTERPAPARKPAAYTRTDDIIYGRKYGMALTMNLLKPASPNGAAVLWVVSGGFFSSHEETLSPGFVSRVEPLLSRGYTVFLVVHGSAPQFELREVTKDIHRAVRFVRCRAGDYGIDPQRIGITGGSAGGYLATWLGTTGCDGDAASADPVERASSRVQAVACFFPGTNWMNFPTPGDDVIAISERLGTISGFRFKEYEPKKREFIPILDREKVRGILKELSPINHVTAQSAPMLFIFGDKDTITTIQTQGTPMLEKLKAAGVPCDIIVKPGLGHSWPGIEKDSEAIADWFDAHLLGATLTPQPAANPSGHVQEPGRAEDRLSPAAFADPPIHARPGAFWAWLNGSITQEQVTRDLEAMKRGGMRGGEIWDVAAYADPDGRVPAGPAFLGPESTRLIAHAIREADRLGLELGMIASSGWNAGGSWIPPEHAGKGLYQSTTTVAGATNYHAALPMPELPKGCPRDAQGRPLYLREVAVLAVPHDASNTLANADQVVDLTKMIEADGRLRWDVPAGDWDILRFVCANHGQQLIVPSPNSGGPMIDFFDPRATEYHLHHMVSAILKELGRTSFEGASFKTMEFDSMELDGFTPWNEVMAAEFQRRAGYPVLRYLPLLAGWKLADQHVQEQFLYDWQKVVSDQLIDSHYAAARKVLGSYGLKLIAEAGGPGPPIWDSNPVDGIKALGAVDIPRGEFWIRHRGIFLIKEIASAAHVYNKRLVSAESFTTWRRWVDGPLVYKRLADRALCEGLNDFAFHTFASSPPEAGLPGWAYHAGTDINPAATWWPMVHGLMDYLARCSYMLRQGWFVADVCYYYGDQAPNFFPLLCNVEEKPLLDGLAPQNDFDVCSSEVILHRMRAENGRIVMPDGMSYAALVLPEQDHIPPEVIRKIRALVADGATVIGHQRPTHAPGRRSSEQENQQVEQLVKALWGADEPGGPAVQVRSMGRGRLVIASNRTKALREIGVGPDFEIAGRSEPDLGPLDFVHRKTGDDEFYFIRNKTKEPQALTCRFRVAAEANGQTPEFWWPDSGRRSVCRGWKAVAGGHTELPVELGPLGSVFVVFRKGGGTGNDLDALARDTFPATETPASLTLDGPWQVEFPEGWGAPRTASFEKLQSWTESDHEGIRFFSGIAIYRKSFELPGSLANTDRLFLQLGDLAEIAEVTLNGKRL
ncbi:MAG: glycosyl hydrolase, partial [bacterium]